MALSYDTPDVPGFLYAAYRPIPVTVTDGGSGGSSVPVVYLDVYINTVYYKTYSNTSPTVTTSYSGGYGIITRRWLFDIQDAFQEYLRSSLPALSANILTADSSAICSFFVKVRGSSFDANGFIIPDGAVPIQGNFNALPTSGGGTQSSTFCALNATLQHTDSQNLVSHLSQFLNSASVITSIQAYPMTKRPQDGSLKTGIGQFGFFPIMIPINGVYGANSSVNTVTLFMDWMEVGNPTVLFRFTAPISLFSTFTAPFVLDVPVGLGNMSLVTWATGGGSSTPDMTKIYKYRVYLRENSLNTFFWTSGWMDCTKACADPRIHFLNEAGGFDFVNFQTKDQTLKTTSGQYQKALPTSGLQRRDFGAQRFGVRSNRNTIATAINYSETAQTWLAELLDTPLAFSEVLSEGDALPDIVPITVSDGDFVVLKSEGRYEYAFAIQYLQANERIRQRG